MSDFRRQVELRAGPALVLVARLPKVVPFLVIAGLLLGGLLAEGALGGLLLLLLAALLGLLLFLSWPAIPQQARVLRSLVLGLVVARAVSFLL